MRARAREVRAGDVILEVGGIAVDPAYGPAPLLVAPQPVGQRTASTSPFVLLTAMVSFTDAPTSALTPASGVIAR